jgi:hypothetical protein
MKFDLKALAVAVATAAAALPVAAQDVPVAGKWETGPRDYRYELELCGPQGQDLCGIMNLRARSKPADPALCRQARVRCGAADRAAIVEGRHRFCRPPHERHGDHGAP